MVNQVLYFVFVEHFKGILKWHSKEAIFVFRMLYKIEILDPKFRRLILI